MLRELNLDALVLAKGSHQSPEDGMCLVEASAFLAGGPFTDHPACVSPVIATFCRQWNDDLGDTERQRLKRFVPLIIGTAATPEIEDLHGWMCADWMIRVHTPAWLRLAGLNDQAEVLENLPALRDIAALNAATTGPLAEARKAAAAAWDAARAAARATAWAAAWDAARATAWAAAWDAARAAAWDAARAAARAAAWDAARAAAWAAAWDAARAAAWATAWDAASRKLEPTKVSLMDSTEHLLEEMCALSR